jgi:acyl-CoA thioesterase-2
LHTAVTSHAVWFHRPFRMDDWCLLTQHSPVTAGGRGFGIGHVLDAGGGLVASYAQESMIRLL